MGSFQPLKKKHLTKVGWKSLSDEWEASSMTQPEFCKTKDINLSAFSYWRTRLSKKSTVPFQSVKIKSSPVVHTPASRSIHLSLPNGIKATIPPSVDESLLKNVFNLLGIL